MCSCSGSCNCNSTTIPRGPQGAPGQGGTAATIAVGNVTALPAGATPTVTNGGSSSAASFNFGIPAGATGNVGPAGLNAYTTMVGFFIQPNFIDPVTINVLNSSWATANQIIFVGNFIYTEPGGFYKVVSTPTPTSIEVIRLDWTIPGVAFRGTNTLVGGTNTLVAPSGTIGASVSEISVLGFDDIIRLPNVSNPGGYQNTASFTIPANSIASINDWIEIEYTVTIDFNNGWTGGPSIRSFQLQIDPNGYGSTASIGGSSSGLFGITTVTNFKLKLYYGGLNGASPVNQTKLIVDTLATIKNSTTNIALNYTNIPSTGVAGDSYLVRTNQAGGVTLFDGALYSWNNVSNSWDGFTGYGPQSTRGFILNENSIESFTINPIELGDAITVTPRFQCYDTDDVVVTNFKITKYTSQP